MLAVPWIFTVLTLLLCADASPRRRTVDCAMDSIKINGGSYWPTGVSRSSVVKYSCPQGMYPYPVQSQKCNRYGRWSPLKTPTGGTVSKVVCKWISCPDPSRLEHGSMEPMLREYLVGNITSYSCFEGYQLRGSPTRTCQPNGKWNGENPICDNGSEHCPNPGTPPGSRRTGDRFGIDDKVTYRCDRGLFMFGSAKRECQENHEWTGTEPACYYKNTYDTPEEASQGFSTSLNALLHVADSDTPPSEEQLGRKIVLKKGGKLHIYIILDASESVGEEDFEKSKKCALDFMDKISSYEVEPKWGIVTFATNAEKIVDIVDETIDISKAYSQLSDFDFSVHQEQSGTNIKEALDTVYKDMSFLKARMKNEFEEVRNVVLLITDGKKNMGGKPEDAVRQMRSLLGITNPGHIREEFLDIYVFGVGEDIDEDEINLIASKKDKEKHVFKLENPEKLAETFEQMIDESDSVGLCGLYREYDKESESEKTKKEKYPWHVSITITRQSGKEDCKGAVVSERHVLTSAHCFTTEEQAKDVKVIIDDSTIGTPGRSKVKDVEQIYIHPEYNIAKKKAENISEYYDYDVALIELKSDGKNPTILFSKNVRPICIPCTEQASGALRLDKKTTTCKQHGETLLPDLATEDASFLTYKSDKKDVKIKLRKELKQQCYKDALKAPIYKDVPGIDWPDVVTDRFLCTGGTDPVIDDVTCKGDSGGSLFLEKKRRMFQVGVISWGNKNLCVGGRRQPTEKDSRDYHINLFEVQDFLRDKLGTNEPKDLNFIQ
ncbi:complement factor B-like [Acipenser ruthenus]|uniref:complement factor B-like n=1 Tax=Acipenser ruthenus TaxID=7906 RepID=UPI00274272EA|nr:complement factor B-like [Acipenser ruthenus]